MCGLRSFFFSMMSDLDDVAGGRDIYLQARTEWLEYFAMLRILDPLLIMPPLGTMFLGLLMIPSCSTYTTASEESPALPEWLLAKLEKPYDYGQSMS